MLINCNTAYTSCFSPTSSQLSSFNNNTVIKKEGAKAPSLILSKSLNFSKLPLSREARSSKKKKELGAREKLLYTRLRLRLRVDFKRRRSPGEILREIRPPPNFSLSRAGPLEILRYSLHSLEISPRSRETRKSRPHGIIFFFCLFCRFLFFSIIYRRRLYAGVPFTAVVVELMSVARDFTRENGMVCSVFGITGFFRSVYSWESIFRKRKRICSNYINCVTRSCRLMSLKNSG